jgi:hypothetical protein
MNITKIKNFFFVFLILTTSLTVGCSSSSKNKKAGGQVSQSSTAPNISTYKQDEYQRLLYANNTYLDKRYNCFKKENEKNDFAKFVQSNVLLEPPNQPNKDLLLTSKKLLNSNEWATFSWYWSSINECINNLEPFRNSLPPEMRDVYKNSQNIENALTEELRLRKINVGKYNQVRLLLSQEESRDIQSIFKIYKKEVEIEKLENQLKVNLHSQQKLSNSSSTNQNLSNAAFATIICSLATGGKAAGCAAGALDSDSTSQDSQLRKQKAEIEQLKTQQMIEKASQEFKDSEREYQKRKEERDKWKPGQTGLR